LQGLGYSIRKTKNAFEISGIPEAVLDRFSLRTAQIERKAAELAKKRGVDVIAPKLKAALGASTREAKLGSIPYPELVKSWDTFLEPAERVAVRSAKGKPVKVAHQNMGHARYASDHAFERASVIDHRRLLTLALRHGVGEVTPEGVRAEMNKLGLLKREEHGRVLVTSKEILVEEQRMLRFAVSGKGACRPIASDLSGWEKELGASRLSDEQRAAVAHVLTSPDRVMILRGVAGSGKTTLTQEAVSYMEAAGKHVVMLAPSAQASRGVLRSEGFAGADTLSRFLIDANMQAGAFGGVIWLDEAGLVGTKSISKLFDLADELQARVVLAGDQRQTAAVERGAALRVLENIAGLKLAEVTDIRRQSGEYKQAVKLLSQGESAEGFRKLDDLGWIKTMPVWDSYDPVAKDYVAKLEASPDKEKGVLIVCPTHAEGDKITAQVRKELKAEGVVSSSEREFTRLVPTQWTEAERGDRSHYAGNEILQFHRNSGDFKAGERVTAADAFASMRPPRAGNFSAYRKESIGLAKGDLIRITANGKSKDGAHKVNNGAVYSCAGFTASGDIALSNGWVLDKNFGTLDFAYVTTSQASQGRTVDHVIFCQTGESYPASNREGFYVAVSRGRKSATIYTDDKRELMQAVERSSPRLAATELMQRPKPHLWRRMRERVARMQISALVAAKAAAYRVTPKKELSYAR